MATYYEERGEVIARISSSLTDMHNMLTTLAENASDYDLSELSEQIRAIHDSVSVAHRLSERELIANADLEDSADTSCRP